MTKPTGDPAWLKSMKKEADKLGIPLRELLTRSTKPAKKPKAKAKTMAAARGGAMMKKKGMAKGGMKKKGMAKGGMKKKGMAKGGMKKKGYSRGGATKRVMKKK
jgi:hypothetical protein